MGLQSGSFPGCLRHSLNGFPPSRTLRFRSMALRSRDKTGFGCGPCKRGRGRCRGWPRRWRFARCRPQLRAGRCSFKGDGVPWGGKEETPWEIKGLSHPHHTQHTSPKGTSATPGFPHYIAIRSCFIFSCPEQIKNEAFASCNYSSFPRLQHGPSVPSKALLPLGGLKRMPQSCQQFPGESVRPGDALNGPGAKAAHPGRHLSHARALHTSHLGQQR